MNKKFFNDDVNEEVLKEQFIKYFGEEKWHEEEMLTKLWPFQFALFLTLGVEPIPVLFQEMKEDARYYDKDNYIGISTKLINDEVEVIKCLIHEIRHYYQHICVEYNDTNEPQLEHWIEDMKKDYNSLDPSEAICLSIEVDAFAYTKHIMNKWFDIDVVYLNEMYEKVIKAFCIKYYK